MANALTAIESLQLFFGETAGASGATGQTVVPANSKHPLKTTDQIRLIWNNTDAELIDPETVTISAKNEVTIVETTSGDVLLIGWHASSI